MSDTTDTTAIYETTATTSDLRLPQIPWLDMGTAEALRHIVTQLVATVPEIVAIILFGSVARHEERPLTDLLPSDVDVLVLFDPHAHTADHDHRHGALSEGLTRGDHALLSAAVVQALIEVPEAAREINLTGALTTFAGWDLAFVERIAQDGILLWSRGPLPPALAPLEARQTPTITH